MLQVKQIVNSVCSSNTFVLSDDDFNTCYLVDIGDAQQVLSMLPNNANVKGVFLTHTHFDHIYGINALLNMFPEISVYTSEYGAEALYSEKKNFSFYYDEPIIFNGENVIVLHDSEVVALSADEHLSVLATPGHCPSSLTYFNDYLMFTGDSFIPNMTVVSKLPRGDKEQAAKSEAMIKALSLGKTIFPGHGDPCII